MDEAMLVAEIRTAEKRSATFEAIRLMLERYAESAPKQFDSILSDDAVSTRAKAILLYYLEEFGECQELVAAYGRAHRVLIDAIAQDIDTIEEEGIDPFTAKRGT